MMALKTIAIVTLMVGPAAPPGRAVSHRRATKMIGIRSWGSDPGFSSGQIAAHVLAGPTNSKTTIAGN